MKNWLSRAMDFLKASLEPPRHELNELDWKAALSQDKKRLSCRSCFRAGMRGDFRSFINNDVFTVW